MPPHSPHASSTGTPTRVVTPFRASLKLNLTFTVMFSPFARVARGAGRTSEDIPEVAETAEQIREVVEVCARACRRLSRTLGAEEGAGTFVVFPPFLGFREDLVGVLYLLETLFGLLVAAGWRRDGTCAQACGRSAGSHPARPPWIPREPCRDPPSPYPKPVSQLQLSPSESASR